MNVLSPTSFPKEKINILLLEKISTQSVNRFIREGYSAVQQYAGALSEEELIKIIKDVHILGIRSKTQITPKIIEHADKLMAIGCFCIGVNQVRIVDTKKKGIAVFNAPYSNTRSVAELVIGSSIMLIRRVIDKNSDLHKGLWKKESANAFELRGKTMGIIGYGNIGSQVSILAESLGMNVIYYDVTTKLPLGNAHAKLSIQEVVAQADIITLHVPEKKDTECLINETILQSFKKGALLINYSRGLVVDLDALSRYLKNGHISGAAIDVYPNEPEKNGTGFVSPLQQLPNVLLTPHIGGSTEEAQERIGDYVSEKLVKFIETGDTLGSLSIPPLALPVLFGVNRILHIHDNIPGVLSAINSILSAHQININSQFLKTDELIGYVVFDIETKSAKNIAVIAQELKKVKGTIKVRILY
ncbi:MAG: phosphoglycerate dehydrogenase [Phycisphaerales bacterium]|nr:phosphoglycerate dehydrogenase [Phycisphaerales bacterium]